MSYPRIWILITALVLGSIAAMNALVDPFGAFDSPIESLEPYKPLGTRSAKAEMLERVGCQHLLLGSSRVEIGFDPTHAALSSELGCNVGLAGTNMWEMARVIAFAASIPDVSHATIFTDFLMFTSRRRSGNGFAESRFNEQRSPVEYRLAMLVGWYATRSSFRVLRSEIDDRPLGYTRFGRRTEGRFSRKPSRVLFANALRAFLTNPETYWGFEYSPERIDLLRDGLIRLQQRGIRLVIVVPPVHALQLEAVRALDLWPVYRRWKRDLTQVAAGARVPLWDFSGYTPLHTEAVPLAGDGSTTWFWEASHFKRALGDRVLDRVYGGSPDEGFGVRLEPDKIDAWLANLEAERERYLVEQPEMVAFFRESVAGLGLPSVSTR